MISAQEIRFECSVGPSVISLAWFVTNATSWGDKGGNKAQRNKCHNSQSSVDWNEHSDHHPIEPVDPQLFCACSTNCTIHPQARTLTRPGPVILSLNISVALKMEQSWAKQMSRTNSYFLFSIRYQNVFHASFVGLCEFSVVLNQTHLLTQWVSSTFDAI